MTRTSAAVLLCLLAISPAMAGTITLNPDFADSDDGYTHTRVLEDANGNIHVLAKLDMNNDDGYSDRDQLVYYMLDPDGDILIDRTFLTTGSWIGRGELAPVDPTWGSTEIAILYHQTEGEILLGVIDPYLHPMDGSDANATATTPAADGGNTGDGSIAAAWPGALTAPTESWSVEYDGSEWTVTGSVTGELSDHAATDAIFPYYSVEGEKEFLSADPVAFKVVSSGDPFVGGDKFTFSVTSSPILVQAAKDPLSDDGDTYRDVHGQFVHMSSGDLGVIWRYGAVYDQAPDQAIIGRFGNFSKSFSAQQTISEAPSAGGYADYGGGDIQVSAPGEYLDLMYTVVPEYTGGDSSDAEMATFERVTADGFDTVVAPTHIFINDEVTRRSFVNLPNGHVLVAFQTYLEGSAITETYTMVFDPTAAATGETLTPNVTPDADGGNTGNGDMGEVFTSLVTPTANWTVTCTDDTTPGSEVWSVETEDDTYEDATTGIYYFTDSGAITFLIEAGGTDFAVGDAFTFSTTAPAGLVAGPTSIDVGETYHHPRLYSHPNGRGILLVLAKKEDDNYDHNQPYFSVYGYDGAALAGPIQAAEIDNSNSDEMIWPYDIGGSMAHDRVVLSWNEYEGDGGVKNQLFLDDIPVDAPIVTSVTPAELDDATGGDIAVTGENFVDGAAVFVGDTEVSSVTFTDAENLTATVPAGIGEGTYAVRVVNPDTLFGTLADALTIVSSGDDDDSDDDSGDDDAGGDDDSGDDDASGGGGDDDDDDGGCCGC